MDESIVNVFLIRHGDRADYDINTGKQWQATANMLPNQRVKDPPLSSIGHSQARDVSEVMKDFYDKLGKPKDTILLSSPYLRCIQTSAPTSDALGLPIQLEHGLAECHYAQNYVADADERWAYFPQIDVEYKPLMMPKGNDNDQPRFKKVFNISTCESFPLGYMKRILDFSEKLTNSLVEKYSCVSESSCKGSEDTEDTEGDTCGKMVVMFSHAASVALIAALLKAKTVPWKMAPTGYFHLTLNLENKVWALVNEETAGENTHCKNVAPGTFAWGFQNVKDAAEVWSNLISSCSSNEKKEEE